MTTVEGKFGIKATVLADSVSPSGERFTTYEIEYPRIILAELNTHRMLSKNSFSSRAVPFKKMLDNLRGRPVRFGANQAGMQDSGEHSTAIDIGKAMGFNHLFNASPDVAWDVAKDSAIDFARAFSDAGYHKQVFNRLLEPWQMMKTVISGTEWANFGWLRDHQAADPTFEELARVIREARDQSTPKLLQPGEWHLPYIDIAVCGETGEFWGYLLTDENGDVVQSLTTDEAIKISCARCAAVSYRNEGYGLEKSLEVYENLVGSDRKHASAFEHCATPMEPHTSDFGVVINHPKAFDSWQEGITHVDRNGQLWSGNLKGWIQFRKLIPGENYEG